jgi:hypothetical protein
MTGTYYHTQLFSVEMGSCKLFFLRLALNQDLPGLSLLSSYEVYLKAVKFIDSEYPGNGGL